MAAKNRPPQRRIGPTRLSVMYSSIHSVTNRPTRGPGNREDAERQASAGARDGVKAKRNDLAARAPLHALVRRVCRQGNRRKACNAYQNGQCSGRRLSIVHAVGPSILAPVAQKHDIAQRRRDNLCGKRRERISNCAKLVGRQVSMTGACLAPLESITVAASETADTDPTNTTRFALVGYRPGDQKQEAVVGLGLAGPVMQDFPA